MDLNTIALIAFVVMMLWCCGPLDKAIRRDGESRLSEHDRATADAADPEKLAKAGHGGCCH